MIKIPVTIIQFKCLPDFVLEQPYYKKFGGFFKFCAFHSIKPCDVKKVVHKLIKVTDFPITEWGG